MGTTGYTVSIVATGTGGWDNTNNCQYLQVGSKTNTTMVLTLRNCTNGAAVNSAAALTFDYMVVINN
jgi:hypothetical protein